jgi:hypothetical protein
VQQQPKPVDPTSILLAHLEAQEWNVILGVLHKMPYWKVARMIGKLSDQLMQQSSGGDDGPAGQPEPPAQAKPMRVSGGLARAPADG